MCSVVSHVRLFVTPGSLPGYTVHGVSQARILERVAISFSKEAIVHNRNPELQTPSPPRAARHGASRHQGSSAQSSPSVTSHG